MALSEFWGFVEHHVGIFRVAVKDLKLSNHVQGLGFRVLP